MDLNVNPETVQLPEENIKENLCDLGAGDRFLGMTSKTESLKV